MNKVYILQKDLPDAKAGDDYFWNGASYTNNKRTARTLHDSWVKDNPEWFKLKEEEKPVSEKVKVVTSYWNVDLSEMSFIIRSFEEGELYHKKISVERLAEILIAESKGELRIMNPASDGFTWYREDNEIFKELARKILSLLVMDLGYDYENKPIYGHHPLRHQTAWNKIKEHLSDEEIKNTISERVNQNEEELKYEKPKLYTEKELLEAEEKAFNAARKKVVHTSDVGVSSHDKYSDFSHFKNSKV